MCNRTFGYLQRGQVLSILLRSEIMGTENIGNYSFCVEPYTEDATGRVSLSFLGNQILRCAGMHATAHGFGYEQLIAHNLVWVLSRLVLTFEDRPKTSDQYSISTWVTNVYRQFTERLFRLNNAEGKPLGYGFSIWAAIDYKTRQPIDLEKLPDGGFTSVLLSKGDFPISGPGRVRMKRPELISQHRAGFSDLDINGHVNSMRYLEMVLDLFSADFHRSHKIRRVELQFCNESYCGDTLQLFKEDKGENLFDVEIRKEEIVVVRCEIETEAL